MKFAAIASLFFVSVSAYIPTPQPEITVDALLSGVCNNCQVTDKDDMLCAGFAAPLCDKAELTPGYCKFCDGYFEMHSGNGDRDECHERTARFTESETCVTIRVMEARAERARRDAAKQARLDEEHDDKMKAKAAKDAQDKADEAEEYAEILEQMKKDAEDAADTSARIQDEAQEAKQDAKDAAFQADKKAAIAAELAEEANEKRLEAIAISDEKNAQYEAALQTEAAAKAAYFAAVQHLQMLQDEAERLRKVSIHS